MSLSQSQVSDNPSLGLCLNSETQKNPAYAQHYSVQDDIPDSFPPWDYCLNFFKFQISIILKVVDIVCICLNIKF